MGRFSWECAVCGASLHRAWELGDPDAWQEDALLFAANGVTAEGAYDGHGGIGTFTIPEAWDEDQRSWWLRQAERNDADAGRQDETAALMEKCHRLLGETAPPWPYGDASREAAVHARQTAADAPEYVAFTVYHRRCWESAGRPGFAGQSRPSEDQGR